MSYEVIARKWRPQTFDEVVGQDAITRTLRNAVEHERLHHAYLFTGARGVGKTTTARILAKALNCAKGVTPEPCGVCPSCVEVTAGGSLDVIEIDAASHTGVDNVRDVVISSVGIAPARDRYKVFIVDEVHQLSTAAFNALLKTLEEPPSRVVFILATTELHKVPDTITSRCQIFEFRTIPLARIQAKLGEIAEQMRVSITPSALAAVARAGEGSMRDAQSALDQVISFSGESIDMPDVVTALGIVGDETLYDVVDAISRSDGGEVLRSVSRLAVSGHDLRTFARALMRVLRNLLVVRAVGYDAELVDAADADAERVANLAMRFSEAELVRMFSLVADLEQDIRKSADPRFQLEIGLVRLAELPRLRPLDEILERLKALESRLLGDSGTTGSAAAHPAPSSRFVAPSRPAPPSAPQRPQRTAAPEPPPEPPPFYDDPPEDFAEPVESKPLASRPPSRPAAPPAPPPPAPPAAVTPLEPERHDGPDGPEAVEAILAYLESQRKMFLLTSLGKASAITLDKGKLEIRFPEDAGKLRASVDRTESRSTIEAAAREITGRTVRVSVVTGSEQAPVAPATKKPSSKKAAPEPVRPVATPEPAAQESSASDPIVQAVIDTFQGKLLGLEPPEESES